MITHDAHAHIMCRITLREEDGLLAFKKSCLNYRRYARFPGDRDLDLCSLHLSTCRSRNTGPARAGCYESAVAHMPSQRLASGNRKDWKYPLNHVQVTERARKLWSSARLSAILMGIQVSHFDLSWSDDRPL